VTLTHLAHDIVQWRTLVFNEFLDTIKFEEFPSLAELTLGSYEGLCSMGLVTSSYIVLLYPLYKCNHGHKSGSNMSITTTC
jgi:hypothetical protein